MNLPTKNVITAVIVQKNDPSRCSVFLDGIFAFGCSMDLVLQYSLSKGKRLTEEEKALLLENEAMMQLKQKALAYALYKPRTAMQVRTAMLKKKYTPEEADIAVQFLREFGYVNDRTFAAMFIRDYLQRKPSGTQKIKEELRKRGISSHDIEDTLSEVFPQAETEELARKAAVKKLRSLASKPLEKQKHSLISYLQRQGFSWEVIEQIVREMVGDKEQEGQELPEEP